MMKNLNAVFNLLLFPFVFVLFLTGTVLFASNSPTISISPASFDINESSGTVIVELNISISEDPNASDINVTWATVDGSATTAAGNYVSNTDKIIFAKGSSTAPTSIPIYITVNSDVLIGSDITFTVVLTQIDTNTSLQSYSTGQTVATITIINSGPPTANNKTYQVDVNGTLTGNIITDALPNADSSPNNDPIWLEDDYNTSTFTVDTNGNFTYVPAPNFCDIYSFPYNITDGIEVSNTATITIDVRNILQNPANDDYLINRVDQNLSGNLLTNDPNQTYTVVSYSQPSNNNGSVTVDSNGSFEYTPDDKFVGDVTFDYTVSDGTDCSTATATVTIKITDMCNHVIPFDLCSVPPTTNTIIADDPQVYSFELNTSVILDLNLTNTGKKLLEYDFRAGDCDSLFAEQTTSYLPQGASIDIQKEYPAATYFLGLGVGQNETDILLSICYDTNISGNDGQAYSHIGINDINSTPNSNYWYNDFPNITTKVVNKSFDIRASYLDENQTTAEYDGRYDKNGEVGMSVILSMAQDNCKKIDNSIVATMILDHQDWYKESTNTIVTIPYAAKNRQFHITSFDFGALFRAATGLNCGNSSLNSSLCLLPACFNTISNIKAVFPPAFYPNVLICVNGDGNGLAPCDSSAYMGGCGGKKGGTISPSIYDNDLGCASCLQDAMELNICSDTFAIRPDKFDVNITHLDFPNLLRAGQEYGVSLTALDANATPAPADQYTIIGHNFIDDLIIDTTKYFKDGTEDTANLLHGTPDLNDSIPAYMVDGLSSKLTSGPTTSGTAEEAIKASYNDVGKVELHIYDTNWAAIDNKDTPMDCNSTAHTYICGDRNVTFIPHHFAFAELNITNHAGPDNNFTYIADNRGMPETTPVNTIRSPMAARIQTRIQALTKDGNITQNFKADDASYPYDDSIKYYENNVSVTFVVKVPSTGTNKYLYPDANETNTTTISDPNPYNYIGFGRTGKDSNGSGTRDILWDESNFPLDFNFRREINEPANPFIVDGSYLKSIKIISHYVDPDDADTADINGSRLGDWNNTAAMTACATDEGCEDRNADNNATFYYGRTRPSRFFYDGISAPDVKTEIAIDVYCDLGYSECDDWDINVASAQIAVSDWWLSLGHIENSTRHDGNVTLRIGNIIQGAGAPSISSTISTDPANVQITSGGRDTNVTVTANATELPMTVEIELVRESDLGTPNPYTNEWLIYNNSIPTAPSPFYKVQFVGTAGWAGYGDTGHVVDSNASIKTNKRLGW